jgi:hypothetical protein
MGSGLKFSGKDVEAKVFFAIYSKIKKERQFPPGMETLGPLNDVLLSPKRFPVTPKGVALLNVFRVNHSFPPTP